MGADASLLGLTGYEPVNQEVSVAPSASHPHACQGAESSASRARGFACHCDCPEPGLEECSTNSGLPNENCPCSLAGLSDRLSNWL